MTKRLARAIGAGAGVVAVVVLIVVIVAKQQNAARDYEHDRHVWCDSQSSLIEQKETCPDEGPQRSQYLPWWYVLFTWPEGITTWAIIATGFAIAWQADETRRSANEARRSVKLQTASMQQWIVLQKWKSYTLFSTDQSINVRFSVSNPTSFLLTLRHAFFIFDSCNPPVEITFIYRTFPLAPSDPLRISISIPLTPQRMNSFRASSVGLSVQGQIIFENALGKIVTQDIDGLLSCSPTKTTFESSVGLKEGQRK